MKKEDFQIGCEFYTGSGKWRCTDIGTRVIIAVKLDKKDESFYSGPPYALEEQIFDEYDFGGCDLVDRFREFRKTKQLKPCSRCGSTEPTKRGVIISMDLDKPGAAGMTRVCTDCKTDADQSCIKFGQFKWICDCGANIWDDDEKTDRSCLSCGMKRNYWHRVDAHQE